MNTTNTSNAALVGTYRLAERLGEGGMGEVYRAVDTMLEREVALKVLRPELSERQDTVDRFRIEAIALARLHHRHIAAVYAFFQDAGRYHIAMQYVRGQTLEAVLQERGQLPWREAAAVAIDVLTALEHAHGLGVVHRDLKPANLMIDREGRTVVMDFGIARVLAKSRQTRAGTLVGTLEYIAPEVVRGEDVDARSDLYALGCVMYEMVTGTLPFDATSDFALMRAHAEQAPQRPSVRAGELPAALENIILRMLEKQPARRYASAAECLQAVKAAIGAPADPKPKIPRKTAPALAGQLREKLDRASSLAQAGWRWLALPQGGGWPAWQQWLRANSGLASVAGVALGAVVLGLVMATRQVCCSAPVVLPPAPLPQVAVTPAPAQPTVIAVEEPPPAAEPAPEPVIVRPRTVGNVEAPPVAGPARPTAPPPLTARPQRAPQQGTPQQAPGWYVNR